MASTRPGRHSAGDGSFGHSAGTAAGKAVFLLVIAVAIGVVLLNTADDTPAPEPAGSPTPTTERRQGTTTSARPTTTTAPVRQPRDVKVLAANATTVMGAAGRVRDSLRGQGYNVLAPAQARATNTSSVFFTPTFEREAQAVAQALALPPTSVKPLPDPPPTDLRGANVVVVIGPDLARRPAAGGATTTTRARSRSRTARD